MSADVSKFAGDGARDHRGGRGGVDEIGGGRGGRCERGSEGDSVPRSEWARCGDRNSGERDNAVCLGGVARGETAKGNHGVGVFQSVSEDSERVSADVCDCAGFGAGVVDGINATESGDCDQTLVKYFLDAGDGEVREGNGELDGRSESDEREVARAGNANCAGVDEGRLRERAPSAGAQWLGRQKCSCAAKEVMACSSLGNLPWR